MPEITLSTVVPITTLVLGVTIASIVCYLRGKQNSNTDKLLARFQRDWRLFKKCWWKLVLFFLVMTYLQLVGTAFAFIRHRQMVSYVSWDAPRGVDSHNISYISGYMFDHTLENKLVLGNGVHLKVEPRLHDLGFDILPDLSWNSWSTTANDGLQYVFIATTLCVMGATYFLESEGCITSVHVVQIAHRVLRACAIGLFFRAPMYLATSLPGPASHCVGTDVPDKEFTFAIFVLGWMGERNCGDLIFSGHFFLATTMVLNALFYLRKMFSQKAVVIVGFFLLILELAQMHTIILSRSHYTVDIVAGLLIAVYNWIANLYFFPDEIPLENNELREPAPTEDDGSPKLRDEEELDGKEGKKENKETTSEGGSRIARRGVVSNEPFVEVI